MKTLRWFVLVLGLLLAPSPLLAQDKFTLKIKDPGVNVPIQNFELTVDTTTFKSGPKEEKKTKFTTYEYTETILEAGKAGELPLKVKRVYQRAEQAGPSDKDKPPLPFHGKTLLIEKKGDKYVIQIEGGDELKAGDLQGFGRFTRGTPDFKTVLLPVKPVNVGDSWDVDLAPFKQFVTPPGGKVDIVKQSGTAKLTKVHKSGKTMFGTVEGKLQFVLKFEDQLDGKTMTTNAKIEITVTLDACLDGSIAQGQLTGFAKVDVSSKVTDAKGGITEARQIGDSQHEERWQEVGPPDKKKDKGK